METSIEAMAPLDWSVRKSVACFLDWLTQPIVDSALPGQVILGGIRKKDKQTRGAIQYGTLFFSTHFRVPALTFYDDGLWYKHESDNKSPSSQATFGHGV